MEATWKLSSPFVVVHALPASRRSSIVTHRAVILVFTFLIYVAYHLSRKPISCVKSVLHTGSGTSTTSNATRGANYSGGWKPFDGPDYQSVLGSMDYAFLFAYAIGMFISGHIAERTNLRHFLAAGMVASGIFTALFGLGQFWDIHSLWYYLIVQAAGGLVQSSGWPAVVTCVANWFGKGRRGLVMGLWNSHTSVGNILGSLIAGWYVERNWGLSFIVPGFIIFVMALPVLLFLVPHPEELGIELQDDESEVGSQSRLISLNPHSPASAAEHQCENEARVPTRTRKLSEKRPLIGEAGHPQAISFMRALRIPGVIEFSLCLFFAKLVSYTFLFWLPSYIQNTAHFSPEISADMSTLFDVGGIVGGIFAGVVSDYLGGRALTCLVMLFFAAPSLFLYDVFGSSNVAISLLLLFVCGALVNGPYCLITTAVSADLGTHPSLHGNAMALATVTSIIDGTGSMGAALGPLLTGLISPTGWRNVFYMLMSADVAALLISWYIYVKYDRRSPATVSPSHSSAELSTAISRSCNCRNRIELKPTCCRLTMFHWFLLSFVILVTVVLFIVIPGTYQLPPR